MQVKMNKNLLFFVINIFLFVLTLWKAIPIWFLFLFFSIFYFVKLIKKGTATIPMKKIDVTYSYGVLDNYADDGDEDDKNFGLFIELMKQPVFVDIKEDKYLDKRKKIALHLFSNTAILEKNLELFINSNPKFKESFISSIGLHSTDTDRAEVFWEPTGYTLLSLEKLEFVVSKK
jgi:hypothetical protein